MNNYSHKFIDVQRMPTLQRIYIKHAQKISYSQCKDYNSCPSICKNK
jgi:hypothetical protein